MEDIDHRVLEDLRNRRWCTAQPRVMATGMCLFNLYISKHYPFNININTGIKCKI